MRWTAICRRSKGSESWSMAEKRRLTGLALKGLGARSIRALALISKLVYGTEPSWRDPVEFSFSHGGKDGFPYPVDRKTYDKSIEILRTSIENAKIGGKERIDAIRRLKDFLYFPCAYHTQCRITQFCR